MDTKRQVSPPKIAEQAEAWTQLFNAYPFPVLWCRTDGSLLRVNPVGQRILGERAKGCLSDLDASEAKVLLQTKLRLVSTEGHCQFAAPLAPDSDTRMQAQWFMQILGSMQEPVVQVVIVCDPPSLADSELNAYAGFAGGIAEQRSQELLRLRQDYRLEMIQRRRQGQELKQSGEDLAEAKDELMLKDRQLVQSDKMVSLGQMTAGITHDINNPLTYLSCNLHTLKHYSAAMQRVLEAYRKGENPALIQDIEHEVQLERVLADVDHLLSDCLQGTRRVEEIASSLQNFARRDDSAWGLVDLSGVIEEALRIAAHQLGAKCKVVKELNELPAVRCHSGQICQVLVNLFVNAAQAMPEGGELSVETEVLPHFVQIRIKDSGQGMPPEVSEQIFTPFFTTKAAGKGTGLGLFVSREIIEKHEGSIEVESKVGEGTVFTICLPSVEVDG